MRKWNAGDRVTRQVYLDDGTWNREGDKCLSSSPRKHGVVAFRAVHRDDEVFVRFDDGELRVYLDHGLDAEPAQPDVVCEHCRQRHAALDKHECSLEDLKNEVTYLDSIRAEAELDLARLRKFRDCWLEIQRLDEETDIEFTKEASCIRLAYIDERNDKIRELEARMRILAKEER